MVRDADKRDEKPEFQAAARQCTSRCSWGEPSVVDIMVWEKFFDRVNHDHSDASGSQANQRKGLLLLIRCGLQAGSTEGGLITASREGKQIYDFSLSYQNALRRCRRSSLDTLREGRSAIKDPIKIDLFEFDSYARETILGLPCRREERLSDSLVTLGYRQRPSGR
jgi:hypothetical protein